MIESMVAKEITRYQRGQQKRITDQVIQEAVLTINVNGENLFRLDCLPQNLEELGTGFLYAEGLVNNSREILSCRLCRENLILDYQLDIPPERIASFQTTRRRTSGCGQGLAQDLTGERKSIKSIILDPEKILLLMQQFTSRSDLFQKTGGVHLAALAKDDRLLFFAEDIGRHNAVDKVLGMAVQAGDNISAHLLLTSGRISSEILRKVIRVRIPVIVSRSAPTSAALLLAEKYGVTVIGFARNGRMNIYNNML